MELSFTIILLICLIVFLSAFAHGIIGFAFPLMATPLVALLIDIKIAVAITVIPNLIINMISIYQGKINAELLKTAWPIALYVAIGTVIGTKALLYFPEDLLKLILVMMIFVYLLQDQFKKVNLIRVLSQKTYARPFFSLLGGFFSGSVSTGSVPLVLYFMSIQFPPFFMSQVMNASFAGSKVIQFITLELAGGFQTISRSLVFLLSVLSIWGVLIGFNIQNRVSAVTYFRLLRGFLTTIGFLLLSQIVILCIFPEIATWLPEYVMK